MRLPGGMMLSILIRWIEQPYSRNTFDLINRTTLQIPEGFQKT
jgi:hypothetical protein